MSPKVRPPTMSAWVRVERGLTSALDGPRPRACSTCPTRRSRRAPGWRWPVPILHGGTERTRTAAPPSCDRRFPLMLLIHRELLVDGDALRASRGKGPLGGQCELLSVLQKLLSGSRELDLQLAGACLDE